MCGTLWSWVPSLRSSRPPPACHPAASPPEPSAARPAASCAETRSHRHGAAVHAPFHHAARVANGSTRYARALCPSASTASCPNLSPARGSWWRGCPPAGQRGSASPLPKEGLRSPLRTLHRPAPANLLSRRSDCVHQSSPCSSSSCQWPVACSQQDHQHQVLLSITPVSSQWSNRQPITDNYFFFAACRFEAFNGSTVPAPPNPRRSLGGFFAFEITT